MKALGKALLVLIATLMVADPVMACCFPASVDSNQVSSQTGNTDDQMPCHGAAKTSVPDAVEAPLLADLPCPGCDNCVSSMMSTGHFDSAVFVRTLDEEREPAFANASTRNTQFVARITTRIRPLEPQAQPTATLTALKQKLQI